MQDITLPFKAGTASLPVKSASKPQQLRQWEHLIGKSCEFILKIGYTVWGHVDGYNAHSLCITNASIQRRDAQILERHLFPIHIDCQNIAIAIEQEAT